MSKILVAAVGSFLAASAIGLAAGEVLYNGIELPDVWPPKATKLSREPLAPPPHMISPPAVIPIDLGRQLFVDDFLVQQTTLRRVHHLAAYHPGNPVLQPDQAWEGRGAAAASAVFSDGVWYDPAERLFKAWYLTPGGLPRVTGCATSRDGLRWQKPAWDVVPGTGAVLADEPGLFRDSSTVWLDLEENDSARRFKMFRVVVQQKTADGRKQIVKWIKIHLSSDGVHWKLAAESDPCGDRTTVFYNPFRKVWVYGLRDGGNEVGRCRYYYETRDVLDARWRDPRRPNRPVPWVGADRLDAARPDLNLERDPNRPWDIHPPQQLYNLDCVAYESLLLGLFSVWRGQPLDRPKINEVCVGYSRDGFHWARPDRRAFCGVSEEAGDWNWGNVQSAGGCCLVVGDRLWFYVSGRQGIKGTKNSGRWTTGLATLRRDGFTSMDAGNAEGQITTRPVQFSGRRLFVNLDAPQGSLTAEVLDAQGRPIAPFTRSTCRPICADATRIEVQWAGAPDLAAVVGKPVRFRFNLRQGRLYAFWVSRDASGASGGYVAAGGPGFAGTTDQAGSARIAE